MTKPAVDEAIGARASIATAAIRLIAQGYDATTVDQIARKAGSSRATVLRYFGSKEDILFHRYDREMETLCADLGDGKGPYLVGLVDRGEIPSRKVGSRRRLKLADVLLYRKSMMPGGSGRSKNSPWKHRRSGCTDHDPSLGGARRQGPGLYPARLQGLLLHQ